MDQIKIGGFIAEERKRKGYTQKILSEKLGISDKTISKWERGKSKPNYKALKRIAEYCKKNSIDFASLGFIQEEE